MLETWDRDLPGLSDDALRERRALAVEYERRSEAPGPGATPRRAGTGVGVARRSRPSWNDAASSSRLPPDLRTARRDFL